MQKPSEYTRRGFGIFCRAAAAFFGALAVLGAALAHAGAMKLVTVRDEADGSAVTVLTGGAALDEVVRAAGYHTGRYDETEVQAAGGGAAQVMIRRAFYVALKADGVCRVRSVVGGTVAGLLAADGIELDREDVVEPALNTPLEPGLEVRVRRVTYGEETRRDVLEPAAVERYRQTLPEGAVFAEDGRDTYDVVYRTRLVDGLVEDRTVLSMKPAVLPRDAGSTAFEENVPCSRIAGFDGVEMGPDGLPTEYARVMEGAVCTAYSSAGGMGASGLGLYCGTVAVNPGVIPYGTRMFITSADRSFVYGFAIATDTGTALMEGIIDLDLYFEDNAECAVFGKRWLNVYILG